MSTPHPTRRQPPPSEEGFILLAAIFLLVLFTLAISVAAPRIAKQIQLDRERETMERGKQYKRAIQLYYRQFQAYPPNLDALVKTNEIRFLRQKYKDPMTGKDDWKPILFGQNKAPTAMGFFGQPLAGSATTVAGTGPSGGNGVQGASPMGGSSLFNSGGSGTGPGTSAAPGGMGDSSSGPMSGASSPMSSPMSGAGGTSTSGSSAPGSGSGSDSGSSTGSGGQTFGGAGIIGFEPGSPKQSIMLYKKKDHYNQWEFVYDPLADQTMTGGNTGTVGQPASSTSTPVGSSPFGSSSPSGSGSPSGSSSPFGSGSPFSSSPGTGSGNNGSSSSPMSPGPQQ